ncbi:hypothetical protein AGR1A_Cc40245 [Agrobacterium fabacearum CFBP 5771]|uniref:hypothetical protein n=1 Tax=Agrobacterium tumefaciens TaxID=358 RepID=UPI0009BB76B1|nr:hypothetical protein [Agrobacterium tumefaciens]CVI17473.1 hypothetical protein AGR1A_Cc40245 [Agrobacterium fabacearum CFBP 5771]
MPKTRNTTENSPIGEANAAHSNPAFATKDVTLESWLRDEVAPVYDAYKADPTRAVILDEGMARVWARIENAVRT